MTISAPFPSSNGEYDCSNANHRYSALVYKGKDVGFVSGIGFEAREAGGEMYVQGLGEDLAAVGSTALAGFLWDFDDIGATATVLSDCIIWTREI